MEKWQAELYSTPLWLLQTFIGVVIVCALLIFALRRTIFGRQFWRVLQPCLSRANIAKIVMMVAFLLLLLLLEVRFSVLNTFSTTASTAPCKTKTSTLSGFSPRSTPFCSVCAL